MEEIYLSAREVAEHINSKVRTIQNWAAAGNLHQNSQGKYGLISAFKFKVGAIAQDLEKTKVLLDEARADYEGEYRSARNRKAIAEADRHEVLAEIKKLELEKLRGVLIDAEKVEETWSNLITTCGTKFAQLPAKLALQLSGMEIPEEIQQLLTDVIYECLSELGDLSTVNLEAEEH
ncbi:MAG: hypothetical protein AAF298_00410 [Cyanobacteria bacterium P01_A01_bin.40]